MGQDDLKCIKAFVFLVELETVRPQGGKRPSEQSRPSNGTTKLTRTRAHLRARVHFLHPPVGFPPPEASGEHSTDSTGRERHCEHKTTGHVEKKTSQAFMRWDVNSAHYLITF